MAKKNIDIEEDEFKDSDDDKIDEFNIVQKCPRCNQLSLSYSKEGRIVRCSNCGYEVK